MKAVMLSIHPRWCGLIASGKKILEVRKTKPKLDTPFKCYIYCTNDRKIKFWTGKRYSYADDHSHNLFDKCGNGKIIGEFICDTFVVDKTYGHDPLFCSAACFNQAVAASYCLKSRMYGWHITNLKIYDTPKDIDSFFRPCNGKHSDCSLCVDRRENVCKSITRPPQSWRYVEQA